MRRRTWLAGALITLVAIPQHAHSQSEKVRLAGKVVTDAAAPQPIGGVEVLIVDLGNATTSAKNGSFELTKIPSGSHRVRFRRIGYAMRDTALQFNGADSVVIAMTPITELDSVKVVGKRARLRDGRVRKKSKNGLRHILHQRRHREVRCDENW